MNARVVLLAALLTVSCSSTGPGSDVAAEATLDTAPEAFADTAPEAFADTTPDATPDVTAPAWTAASCVADPACPLPLLNAHRGLCGDEPENTLAAFAECEQLAVPMFEVDLRMTSDGHVVVMHDSTVDRTTDGETRYPGRTEVSLLTLAEFQALVIDDARCADDPDASPARCHPCSFADLLAFTTADSVLFLDFKDGDPATVAADINAAGAGGRILFFDSDLGRLRAYREAVPGGLVMPRAEAEADFATFLDPANDDLELRWVHGDPYHAVPAVTEALKARGVRLYFNLFTLSDVPFAAAEALDDPAKKQPWLDKAHAALDQAIADGGSGFGTEFAPLGAAYLYPHGFGAAR